ncbi:MAG: hypothetical protein ACK441_14180, partial [Burkholderiales bacterium]
SGALERFNELMAQALGSIPDCRGEKALRSLLRAESQRLIPSHMLSKPQASKQSGAQRELLSRSL